MISLDAARAAAKLQNLMKKFGYETVDLPILQPADLFLTRAGDALIERLFTFERYGRQYALRPEFTAAAAHHFVASGINSAVRWQFSGPVFEDSPDSPNQVQRYSVGAEYIGGSGVGSDAEIIAMAAQGLKELGFAELRIDIGHVGLQRHLLELYGITGRLYRILLSQRETLRNYGEDAAWNNLSRHLSSNQSPDIDDEIDLETLDVSRSDSVQPTAARMLDALLDSTAYGMTMGGRTRKEIAERVIQKHVQIDELETLRRGLSFLAKWTGIRADIKTGFDTVESLIPQNSQDAQQLLHTWKETVDILIAVGFRPEQIALQPDLARNWEYYTGFVFGIESNQRGYLASGGRYDELVPLIASDGRKVPAVGFAYYLEKIQEALLSIQINPMVEEEMPPVAFITPDGYHDHAMIWANLLREHGWQVIIQQMPPSSGKLLRVLPYGEVQYADKNYAPHDINQLKSDLQNDNNTAQD